MRRKRIKTAPFVASSTLSTIKRAHKRVGTPHYNYVAAFVPRTEVNIQVPC